MTVVPDGPALRRMREEHRLTIEQLAKRSGVSAKTIGRIELGQTRGSYTRTLQELAGAMDDDWVKLIRPAPTLPGGEIPYQPADDKRAPQDKRQIPPPSWELPPVPLRANTIEILRVTHRVEQGRRFTTTAKVCKVMALPGPEQAAIGCKEDGVGAAFELSARTGHTTTTVTVYSRSAAFTLLLRDAIDSGVWVDMILVVHVVLRGYDAPTVSERSELGKDIYRGWKGFSFSIPGERQPWALRVAQAEPASGGPRTIGPRKPRRQYRKR